MVLKGPFQPKLVDDSIISVKDIVMDLDFYKTLLISQGPDWPAGAIFDAQGTISSKISSLPPSS